MNSILNRLEAISSRLKTRMIFTLIVIIILLSGYLLLNNNLSPKVDLLLPLDEQIPYWPWTASVYFSLYPMYLTAAFSLRPRDYVKVVLGVTFMTLFSFVCFTLITAHYPRPDPSEWAHSFWAPLINLMVMIDSPGNTCPSLHVSTSLYVGWTLRHRSQGWIWLLWGLVVSLSTLTLKQHFVWDWVGGLLLVILTVSLQNKLMGEPNLKSHQASTQEPPLEPPRERGAL